MVDSCACSELVEGLPVLIVDGVVHGQLLYSSRCADTSR